MTLPIDLLRHRVDVATALLPDKMNKTEIATFAFAQMMQGISEVVELFMVNPEIVGDLDLLRRVADDCKKLSEELIDGC